MKIGQLLRNYRAMNELGVRDLAVELQVSISTISRIENDESIDLTTMMKLLNWMFKSIPS